MKTISLNQMSEIEGGVSDRDCYLAGLGALVSYGILGFALGWAQSNYATLKECFSGE